MSRPLGRDHKHVDAFGRHDLAEMDVEAVAEDQRLALGHVAGDLGVVDLRLDLIGQQNLDHIGGPGGFGCRNRIEPVGLGHLVVPGALQLADNHVEAAVTQVLRLSVPLAAVTDNRDLALFENRGLGVLIVVHLHPSPPVVL